MSTATTPASTRAATPPPSSGSTRETAAASAGVRHAQMTRAILRGYDLTEPDQTHAVRLLGSVFHGYVSLEIAGGFSHSAPDSQETWTGSWTRSTPCCAPGPP